MSAAKPITVKIRLNSRIPVIKQACWESAKNAFGEAAKKMAQTAKGIVHVKTGNVRAHIYGGMFEKQKTQRIGGYIKTAAGDGLWPEIGTSKGTQAQKFLRQALRREIKVLFKELEGSIDFYASGRRR